MQPCTWVAPASTAAMLLATAKSESLCVWMPITPSKRLRTSATISTSRPVSVPPLVSHRQSTSAPARLRGFQRAQRVVRIGQVAVEEVLGVVDHFLAVLLEIRHRFRNQLQVFGFGVMPSARFTCRSHVLPKIETTGRAGLDQRAHVAVLLHRVLGEARGAERGQPGMLQLQLAARGRRTPCPWDWSRASRLRCSRCRARPASAQ